LAIRRGLPTPSLSAPGRVGLRALSRARDSVFVRAVSVAIVMKNKRIVGIVIVAVTWIKIAPAPVNLAEANTINFEGAKTSIVKRCDERREGPSCRLSESLDRRSDTDDDERCGCGGASSASSGAQIGAGQLSSPLSGGPASAGGSGLSGGAAGGGGPGQVSQRAR
jgi:hypothetical protein